MWCSLLDIAFLATDNFNFCLTLVLLRILFRVLVFLICWPLIVAGDPASHIVCLPFLRLLIPISLHAFLTNVADDNPPVYDCVCTDNVPRFPVCLPVQYAPRCMIPLLYNVLLSYPLSISSVSMFQALRYEGVRTVDDLG